MAEAATTPLFGIGPAQPGPAIRRGLLLAVPVGVLLLLELGLEADSKGAIATGALLVGFVGIGHAGARPVRVAAGAGAAGRGSRRPSAR